MLNLAINMAAKHPQTKISNEETNLLEIYFKNTLTSQIFIDLELKIQHSTANATKQFDIHSIELGNPFIETKCDIQFPTLIENIQQVLKKTKY